MPAESPEFALGRMLKVSGQRCSALWTWPKPRLCSCFRNPGRTGNVRFPVPNLTGLCVAWEHPVRAGMPVSEREKEGRLFFYKKCLKLCDINVKEKEKHESGFFAPPVSRYLSAGRF